MTPLRGLFKRLKGETTPTLDAPTPQGGVRRGSRPSVAQPASGGGPILTEDEPRKRRRGRRGGRNRRRDGDGPQTGTPEAPRSERDSDRDPRSGSRRSETPSTSSTTSRSASSGSGGRNGRSARSNSNGRTGNDRSGGDSSGRASGDRYRWGRRVDSGEADERSQRANRRRRDVRVRNLDAPLPEDIAFRPGQEGGDSSILPSRRRRPGGLHDTARVLVGGARTLGAWVKRDERHGEEPPHPPPPSDRDEDRPLRASRPDAPRALRDEDAAAVAEPRTRETAEDEASPEGEEQRKRRRRGRRGGRGRRRPGTEGATLETQDSVDVDDDDARDEADDTDTDDRDSRSRPAAAAVAPRDVDDDDLEVDDDDEVDTDDLDEDEVSTDDLDEDDAPSAVADDDDEDDEDDDAVAERAPRRSPRSRRQPQAPIADADLPAAVAELGIQRRSLEALASFGFQDPTPIQVEAIPALLNGLDVVGIAQTGSGKTVAFGVPMVERLDAQLPEVQGIVLVPTRELAQQVLEVLSDLAEPWGLEAVGLLGGRSLKADFRALEDRPQIVVGTPGRILDHLRRQTLSLRHVRYAVLDEADQMLDIGFLPDIRRILSRTPQRRQTALFSATMPGSIKRLIWQFMTDPETVRVDAEATPVDTITQIYFEVANRDKVRAMRELIERELKNRSLIFCNMKRGVDHLARELDRDGVRVGALHGDMDQRRRDQVVREFRAGQLEVLIATNVAARGLDIPEITHVVNFDVPQNLEEYVHRIGRTGRAGREGKAVTFVSEWDVDAFDVIKRDIGVEISREELDLYARTVAPPQSAPDDAVN